MAKINTKIIYDKEEDILFLTKGKKVKASIEVGDFIIDIDKDGFVASIEILNASENLNLEKEKLANIQKASMVVTYKQNYIYIYLVLLIKKQEKSISIPLTINLGHTLKKEVIKFM